MRSPIPQALLTLLLVLLLSTLTASLPGGGGDVKKAGKEEPKLIPNERATWNCSHKYKVMYSHYKLSGRDWNKTEKEIKRAVSNEGIITRWKFEMKEEEEEEDSFVSSVSLLICSACRGVPLFFFFLLMGF
jgi:hypothetical protein